MARYAAFLRGINVGGHRVSSADLCACFGDLGLLGAAAFRASGNVIFDMEGKHARRELTAQIEKGLEAALGYAVPVFLRDAAQVRAIAGQEPFPPERLAATKGKVQVLLLAKKPSAETAAEVLALASDDDRLAIAGSELYWLPRGGMSDSELDLDAIGRLVGVGTMRTKGTIELIAAKHFTDAAA